MKRLYQTLGLLALSLPTVTQADINPVVGGYTGATLGFLYLRNVQNFNLPTVPGLPVPNRPKLMYKMGGTAAFQLGYRATKNFRAEGQFFYSRANPRRVILGTTKVPNQVFGLAGYTYLYAGMFNAYYDFFTHRPHSDNVIAPYVGAGFGVGRAKTKIKFYRNGLHLRTTNLGRTSTAFAQAIIGLNYWLDDFTAVGIDYRARTTMKKVQSLNRKLVENNLNVTLYFSLDNFYDSFAASS